jgi:ribose transport system permease protein
MGTLSDTRVTAPAYSTNSYVLVPILLLFVLLIVAVLRSPSLVSSAGIGSAVIVTAPLVLSTYALMAVAIAGRATVDLSVGPLLGFINVTLVQLFGADVVSSPLGFFVYAIAVGVAYHIIMALIIIFVRVQPMIVALSGYLALSGINLVIMSRPGGTAPEWMMSWGAGTSIYSPVLVILILATAAWLVFTRSAFYGHLRLMGADERAAYTSGVRINLVRLGAHCIAGVFSGLAALTFTSLISSGDPTQGTTYTLIAVTALVLGGTSLAGGRGGVFGSLLGAVNLFLIGYVLSTFSFGAVQGFVTDLAYGIILVLSLLLTVAIPYLQSRIRRVSPFLVFIVLSLLFLGVILHATFDYAKAPEIAAKAPSATAVAPRQPTARSFVFEEPEAGLAIAAPVYGKPLMIAAVLLVAFVIVLRVSVFEVRRNTLTPILYGVIVAAILLGAYYLPDYIRAKPVPSVSQAAP